MTPTPTPLIAPALRRALCERGGKRAALMPYITGGFPDMDTCAAVIDAATDAGADVVELGVPFSDPVADGPVVQASSHAALQAGVTPDDVLTLAARFAGRVPFVLLAYANTVAAYGDERFARRAVDSGVEGLVVPDLPVDEAGGPAAVAAGAGLSLIPMATPTSTDARLDMVAAAATSFIYCVAVTGVTGARTRLGGELPGLVARLRRRTAVPLVAGFGISTPGQAAEVAGVADGVIIGSALIARVAAATAGAATATAAAEERAGAGRVATAAGSARADAADGAGERARAGARAAAELLGDIDAALRQTAEGATT